MPAKKNSSKTKKDVSSDILVQEKQSFSSTNESVKVSPKKKSIITIVVLLLFIIGCLGFLFKDKFLAATVNGKPILRYELNSRLSSTFGKETLENIIVEKLIEEEAKNQKITVSEEEINNEVDRISKSLGEGLSLEDALSYQGLTLPEFRRQLEIRLKVNKILGKDISVSDEEVVAYLKENSDSLTASGEAEKKAEAESLLREQKISEKIQQWVSDLLANAKITRFLK